MGIFGSDAQDQVDLAHVNERLDRLEAALAAVQAQVTALAAGGAGAAPNPLAGTDPGGVPYGNNVAGGPWLEEVRALKASGKEINAIKLYREHTGLGLKEAKDAVEGLV
jgi:large subunit ribosomal protein L7/L12